MSSWIPWAELLRRVFDVSGMTGDCGAPMRVHAVVMGRAVDDVLASLLPSLARRRRARALPSLFEVPQGLPVAAR